MQIGALAAGFGLVVLGLIAGVWFGERKSRIALIAVGLVATVAYALAFFSYQRFEAGAELFTWIAAPGLLVTAGLAGPGLAPQLWLRIVVSLAVAVLAVGAIFYLMLAYACAINAACL